MISTSSTGRLDGGSPETDGAAVVEDDDLEVVDPDTNDDLFWEDGDPADRRRDPLRK